MMINTKQLEVAYLKTKIDNYRSKGGTMEGLANTAGVSKMTIYNHLGGSSSMSVRNLKRIFEVMETK